MYMDSQLMLFGEVYQSKAAASQITMSVSQSVSNKVSYVPNLRAPPVHFILDKRIHYTAYLFYQSI